MSTNDSTVAMIILAIAVIFGAFLGYLAGRTLTRVEQRALAAHWREDNR